MNPLVSIVIINYNGSRWLPLTLDSCLTQDYQNYEVVVVDDKSTDDSLEIIQQFSRNNPRVKPTLAPNNLGISGARNLGMQVAHGEYIALLDSDDIFLPETVKNYVDKFASLKKEHPNLSMLSTDAWLIDERGKRKGRYISSNWFGRTEVEDPPLWTIPSSWFFPKASSTVFCESYRVGEAPLFTARMKQSGPIAFWGEPNIEYRICMRSISNSAGASVVRAMNATKLTIAANRLDNPILPEEAPAPSWREVAAWTYGRNAKAASVNGQWLRALYCLLLASIADLPRTYKKVKNALIGRRK